MLNFVLFNYFPYGGLQRDFLKIALECQKLGCDINIYTTKWQGERPSGFNIHIVATHGLSNHKRMEYLQSEVVAIKTKKPDTFIVGFNKMNGLDVYFASDTCYQEKAITERSLFYRITPRYRSYKKLEHIVFQEDAKTLILTLTKQQKIDFQKHYKTQEERFKLLPPGIARNNLTKNKEYISSQYRELFNLEPSDIILLFVGSDFKTKGLDRAVFALASLPADKLQKIKLLVVGSNRENIDKFNKQATRLKVNDNMRFIGSRDDVSQIMLSSDILIHPAYTESAGMVLVEAIAAGLPILTTDNCGYAYHVKDANAGIVLNNPFSQSQLNHTLSEMIESKSILFWQENAIKYADKTDLYSLHSRAAKCIINEAKGVEL